MTNSYAGPAIVVADGVEFPVEADLWTHVDFSESVTPNGHVVSGPGMRSWGGVLQADPSVDFWDTNELVLRTPDGREGSFVAGSGVVGTGRLDIVGSGPAPFGLVG